MPSYRWSAINGGGDVVRGVMEAADRSAVVERASPLSAGDTAPTYRRGKPGEGSVKNERVKRQTVDLSGYPDLVVIYLGMRVNRLRGLAKLMALGPQIQKSVEAKPEGLLLHENLLFSLFPLHVGMRQYWRDFGTLETGTAFWHETYFMRGGMEAIYDDLPSPFGFLNFAPALEAKGSLFAARQRLRLPGQAPQAAVAEREL